ncbi:hypothetical protein BGZ83_006268 [Gryganskiella cystojenkinii]|nr:hypothetical protein BGZ83_006268 [Gryganskiella cystojenkinii]
MLASFNGPLRRSALVTLTKQTNLLSAFSTAAPRRFQSSFSSASNDFSAFNNDLAAWATPEHPIYASNLDRLDLAHGAFFALDRPLLRITNSLPLENQKSAESNVDDLTHYFSTLRPFSPPPINDNNMIESIKAEQTVQDFFRAVEEQHRIMNSIDGASSPSSHIQNHHVTIDGLEETNTMHMTSVLRKRRIKMRKHKYQKLRKRTRALRKKLGK